MSPQSADRHPGTLETPVLGPRIFPTLSVRKTVTWVVAFAFWGGEHHGCGRGSQSIIVWPTSEAVRATHDRNEGDAALALNLEMGEPSVNPRGDRGCGRRLGTHRPAEDHLDKILATRHRHVRDDKHVRPLVTRQVNREPTASEAHSGSRR